MTVPIFVENPNTWNKIQVPYAVVEYCAEFTNLDPYNPDNSFVEKLRLTDCYWMNMGYYSTPPIIPVFQ